MKRRPRLLQATLSMSDRRIFSDSSGGITANSCDAGSARSTFHCFLVLNSQRQCLEGIFRTEGSELLSVSTQRRPNDFSSASHASCASTILYTVSLCTHTSSSSGALKTSLVNNQPPLTSSQKASSTRKRFSIFVKHLRNCCANFVHRAATIHGGNTVAESASAPE